MTINTETIRDAAEVLDTLTSTLAVDHPLRTQAAARAKSCVSGLYSAADALDAQAAEIARLRIQNEGYDGTIAKRDLEVERLRTALQGLLDALPSATTHPAIAAARAALQETDHG